MPQEAPDRGDPAVRTRHRPLTGREVWRIGDWGGASAYIGRRWEQVGAAALAALIGRPNPRHAEFTPLQAVSLVQDSVVEQAVQAAGLPHADAVLIGFRGERLALQPVDFKWSIEVADLEQVAGEVLSALLAADLPPLHEALVAALRTVDGARPGLEQLPPLDELELLDGIFLAPDHAPNRAFLSSQRNRGQPRPLRPEHVVFATVEGGAFFSPLPGWEVGVALAAQEGARRALETLEGAEHYYRLGAGVLGALLARRRSIFAAETPTIDPLAELAHLRRTERLVTTEQLIAYLDRVMSARAELTRSLSQLGRAVYPFSAFRATLKAMGIQLPDRAEDRAGARAWNRLYGLTQRELSAEIIAQGRSLVARGQNDAQALVTLRGRSAELARQAASIAQRLVSEQQGVGATAALA